MHVAESLRLQICRNIFHSRMTEAFYVLCQKKGWCSCDEVLDQIQYSPHVVKYYNTETRIQHW